MRRSAERIRRYYEERDATGADAANHEADPAYRFTIEALEREVEAALRTAGLHDLAGERVLDAGCGDGHWLRRLQRLGGDPGRMTGVDLLESRTRAASGALPGGIVSGDLTRLPFREAAFDLVTQFVVLSSIIESEARAAAAGEMVRVLRPGGILLSYDFIFNPGNRRTRGLRRAEYARLFPGCALAFRRVTLAPPVTRRAVRLSRRVCAALERLPFLRSHYLVVIRKP